MIMNSYTIALKDITELGMISNSCALLVIMKGIITEDVGVRAKGYDGTFA
jgi:hypothetical protein